MSDRQTFRLGAIADVRWGNTNTTKASYVPRGYRAYSATGPDGYLAHADYSETGVVVSAIGAQCGRSWLARGQWSCIKNTIRILSRSEDLDIEYLYWLLQSEDIWPKRGSAQPFISQTDAREVSVALPPPAQQHAIAEVLGALDDKIEANRRIESLCWSLARAQFEAAIATADELVPLSSLLKLEYGKALPAGVRRLGPTPVYGSGGIVGRHDKPLVTGPGVIVGRKGTAGSVHWSQRAFFPIDTTFYVTNVSVPMVFAYFALRCLRLDSMNSDSAVPGLNRNTAMCQMVPLPGKEDLATFGGRAEVLVDAAEATASESCALETLRDTLLPELVTGELRVRDAEALVEEAV